MDFDQCPLLCHIQSYILTELSSYGVKFISFDRQKLDLLKYIMVP